MPGLGERLVGGDAFGEEWVVRGDTAQRRIAAETAIDADGALAVAAMARRVEELLHGPQDIEWAVHAGRLWLLQARPMTAVPDPVRWEAPGPGSWSRTFRLGEWLPDAVTPLFEHWLIPVIEDGYLEAQEVTVGARLPFRCSTVNGWYYTAPPTPSPRLVGGLLWSSRGRAAAVLYDATARVWINPIAADERLLGRMHRHWRDRFMPRYRRLAETCDLRLDGADPAEITTMVQALATAAGRYLWLFALVGGSSWKMERGLARILRTALPDLGAADAQVLLSGLAGIDRTVPPHAVRSLDWYHPTLSEGDAGSRPPNPSAGMRHAGLIERRLAAEAACRAALADRPRSLARFDDTLEIAQHYAQVREEQARDLTLVWPVLRRCARRLGEHLTERGVIEEPDDAHFLRRGELVATVSLASVVAERRALWQRRRRPAAPLTIGSPPPVIGEFLTAVMGGGLQSADRDGVVHGQPASAGVATGPARVREDPDDGGTLAAHASLVARELGIPAVVGTGDATRRLRTGQLVTVDGSVGTVTVVGG